MPFSYGMSIEFVVSLLSLDCYWKVSSRIVWSWVYSLRTSNLLKRSRFFHFAETFCPFMDDKWSISMHFKVLKRLSFLLLFLNQIKLNINILISAYTPTHRFKCNYMCVVFIIWVLIQILQLKESKWFHKRLKSRADCSINNPPIRTNSIQNMHLIA